MSHVQAPSPAPAAPAIAPLSVRVYWEDTDAGGVVYHARYIGFLERARSEWMRQLGYQQSQMAQSAGVLFAVRHMQVQFRKPARLDDALTITVKLQRLGRANLQFAQCIYRDAELLLEAAVNIACLDADKFAPCALPAALHAHLREFVEPCADSA